jgi:hypothetical protein
MFRDFQASKGKLFLWMVTWFGVFLLFHWMGFEYISYGFLVMSAIYGSVWFYKVRRDARAKRPQTIQQPVIQPIPLAPTKRLNGLKVPPPLRDA